MKVTIGDKEVHGWKKYPLALLIALSVSFVFFMVSAVLSAPFWIAIYLTR